MASYTVEWVRPSWFLNNAGEATKGFQVRILLLPWNEARDIEVEFDSETAIAAKAEEAVRNRLAVDKLKNVEVKPSKKTTK